MNVKYKMLNGGKEKGCIRISDAPLVLSWDLNLREED